MTIIIIIIIIVTTIITIIIIIVTITILIKPIAESSTTSEPPVITRCWECSNYDDKGTFYDQCPINGTVDPIRAYLGNCTGRCFTHTDDLNDQLIVRGCTSTQWGLPDPLPDDGCYPWYSAIWCVCSSHGCNGVKLGTPTSDDEFDAHIDYTKKTQDPENSGHLEAIDSSLLCFVTALVTAVAYFVF
ncbi:hypothetical protein ACOMHN_050170 [Nucella lapillus]